MRLMSNIMATINLPQVIRQARVKARYSQDEIAQHLGYTHRATVHRIETGTLGLKAEHLIILARLLNIDLNALRDDLIEL